VWKTVGFSCKKSQKGLVKASGSQRATWHRRQAWSSGRCQLTWPISPGASRAMQRAQTRLSRGARPSMSARMKFFVRAGDDDDDDGEDEVGAGMAAAAAAAGVGEGSEGEALLALMADSVSESCWRRESTDSWGLAVEGARLVMSVCGSGGWLCGDEKGRWMSRKAEGGGTEGRRMMSR